MSRWCLVGTLVMLIWLLYPTARCSWHVFKDTPLSEADEEVAASERDRRRVDESMGFAERMWTGVGACYERTPLLGQGVWKARALVTLLSVTIISWLAGWYTRRQRRLRHRELG